VTEYKNSLNEMKQNRFIEMGGTKAIIINFNYLYPSSETFINVLIMFEVSTLGQVVPVRFEASPFKMSGFAKNNQKSPAGLIDALKFVLVVYTANAVVHVFQSYKTVENIFRIQSITENMIDLMIIYL
jgi:hypothetical protein